MAAVTPLLLLLLLSSAPMLSSGSRNAYNINGRVKILQGLVHPIAPLSLSADCTLEKLTSINLSSPRHCF
ncbi:hypothetical protein EPI10_011546 [Gossypium australe]|uniref:Uncharacterized protein n=1 Tax=Gossypium australe TaxID=47621 RepID=A0A5B6W9W3_9ROSI|nr:hypothetical protein EPI10_011546 [Gossypium australe]